MDLFNGALEIHWHGLLKRRVTELVKNGQLIEAIKLARYNRNWTLKQAHDYVVEIRDKNRGNE